MNFHVFVKSGGFQGSKTPYVTLPLYSLYAGGNNKSIRVRITQDFMNPEISQI